jgi:transketolase
MNKANGSTTPQPPPIEELQRTARQIRRDIIEMIYVAQAGHPGGSLSAADIVTALYFRVMRIDPLDPQWPDRDRFILSKGHACPVWYSALCNRGYFDRSHLGTLRKLDSILQGHADMKKTPGVDMTVGSLGQGICAGLGMALGARLLEKDFHVWVMVGDGELQEGSVWEAAMAGAKWRLGNFTVIVDNNHLQNDAATDVTMPVAPIADKWRAFGWHVVEIDGHDMGQIVAALESARDASAQRAGLSMTGKPTVIIAETVKGKGVSFMENRPEWHGKAPNAEQAAIALAEIGGGA